MDPRIRAQPDIAASSTERPNGSYLAGDTYTEVARNDLDEMSLASPAIAGDAIYVRTRTKLYKITSGE